MLARAAEATSTSYDLIGLNAFFIAVTLVVVVLRTYTRVYILRAPGVDDYLAAVAAVGFSLIFFFSPPTALKTSSRRKVKLRLTGSKTSSC